MLAVLREQRENLLNYKAYKEKVKKVYKIPLIAIKDNYQNNTILEPKLNYELVTNLSDSSFGSESDYKFVDFIYVYVSKDGCFRELVTRRQIPDFFLYFYFYSYGLPQYVKKKVILNHDYVEEGLKAKDWERPCLPIFPSLSDFVVTANEIEEYKKKHIDIEQFLSELNYYIALNKERSKYIKVQTNNQEITRTYQKNS